MESKVTCDGTIRYFRKPDIVIPRIKALYSSKKPKFILVFRDPVERAFSHYLHNRRGRNVSFREELEFEFRNPKKSHDQWRSYFHDGLYAKRLSKWWDYFPQDRFCIVLLEDISSDPKNVIKRVFEFLGISKDVKIETSEKYNKAKDVRSAKIKNFLRSPPLVVHSIITNLFPKELRKTLRSSINEINTKKLSEEERTRIPPDVKNKLREKYVDSVKRLENMIERDLSSWLPQH